VVKRFSFFQHGIQRIYGQSFMTMEPDKSRLQELKDKGNIAFSIGDYDTAIRVFSEGLELDPESYVLFSNRSASFTAIQVIELTENRSAISSASSDIPRRTLRRHYKMPISASILSRLGER
jgi:tetratricopeptide (TPR) repeat protein